MKQPIISVIVPVYNVEKYIEKCIQSILNQTFRDFELIVVDDGSTDSSKVLCEKMKDKDKRIEVYDNNKKGVSSARNFGVGKAQGIWICFIDSDDWVDSDYLESFHIEKCSPSTLVIQGIMFRYTEAAKPDVPFFKYTESHLQFPFSDIHLQKVLHNGCPVAKLFNRNILMEHHLQFNEQISLHEDHIFCLEYMRYVKNIYLSHLVKYNYVRRGTETLTSRRHSAENYIIASDSLIYNIELLGDIFDINPVYMKTLISDYGLTQLLKACKVANGKNYNSVYEYIRSRKSYFNKYYVSTKYINILFMKIFFRWKQSYDRYLFYLIHSLYVCKRLLKFI